MVVVTILCHIFVQRNRKIGPDMLKDNWTFRASGSDRAERKGTGLYLFSSDQKTSVNIQQYLQSFKPCSIVSLSADMKCEDVRPGEKPWNLARLILVQHDGEKDRWDLPYLAASFTGTRDWESRRSFFIIAPETRDVRVTAQLSRCTGSFHLKNIHLFPVAQTQIYTWVKRSILFLWGIFAIFLMSSCFPPGSKQILLKVMLALTFVAIIIGTTMPAAMKNQVSHQIQTRIHTADKTANPVFQQDIAKTGHFCFFVLFGLALSLLLPQEPAILLMIHILLLAGGTEMAQFFIDGRTPLLFDFAIDAGGGFSGMMLIQLFGRKRIKPDLKEKKTT